MAQENWTTTEVIEPSLVDLVEFTSPFAGRDEEQDHLWQLGLENPLRYQHGLVIGRFQPLHYGHIYLWKQALVVSREITIAIGSANTRNEDNPFPAETREQMVRSALGREGFANRVTKIVRINDYVDDNFWLQETIRTTGKVDVVVGNNGWVNGIFIDAHIQALEVPLLNRHAYEGKTIRKQLRDQGRLKYSPHQLTLMA